MPTESHSIEPPSQTNGTQDNMPCPNCRALMPHGMRFCRVCGFRLGEGPEEYTETVRFGAQQTGQAASATAAHPQTTPFGAGEWGAMSHAGASQVALGKKKRKSKGPHWIVWVILAVIIVSVAGGSFMKPFHINIGGQNGGISSAPKSKVGASGFTGAMIDSASPPDGPMDKAGLIGGDIITSFDGQAIKDDNDLRKQIAATPIGKTVEVVYTRDGETKKTMLTTVSEDEIDRLTDVDEGTPDGFFGIEDYERVAVPNTNIYGVRVGSVRRNRPAYTSGLRDGDIILELGGIPIRTTDELVARINRATPDSTVKVIVMRGTERMEIPIKVGIDD